ncbi:hypothetical protein ABIB44_001443 [Hymenobacter sp. UYCo722]
MFPLSYPRSPADTLSTVENFVENAGKSVKNHPQ